MHRPGHVRADAKWQIGKSIDALARAVEEMIRIKRVGLGP
jgi:hypothetical protein